MFQYYNVELNMYAWALSSQNSNSIISQKQYINRSILNNKLKY